MEQWCEDNKVNWHYIQPGKPTQNAFIERQNGSMRKELLNAYQFDSLKEVRAMCSEWRQDYNHERPHKALGCLSPVTYAQRRLNSEPKDDESTYALSTNPRREHASKLAPEKRGLVDKIFEKTMPENNQNSTFKRLRFLGRLQSHLTQRGNHRLLG